ncbi:MAG: phage virion morphogenesis protein [Phocaeicola sp.]|uniref:phage virion morphogenesis protein n=1 Tax=Phocaeicola sp. TaxID=2773926 RepID=UPI003FA07AC5
MNIKELNKYLQSLPEEILSDAADIVAETATEYYQSTFKNKAFDGNPWAPAKVPKKTGSLLIDSGALMNSIRPAVITPQRVVISAGNEKVDYVRAHNEGFAGAVHVPAHTRKTKEKEVFVKAHTRNAHIPRREFMGDSKELNEQIHDRIAGYIDSLNQE